MNDSENTINEHQGSATSEGSRAPKGAQNHEITQTVNELRSLLSQFSNLSTTLKTWGGSTLELLRLEIKLNMAATSQVILCSIIFTLLSVLFLFSVCFALSLVTYHFTTQLLVSVGVFIASLGLTLVGLVWWQKRLTKFLGFKKTIDQLQEGWDAFTNQTQSNHSDKTH